MTKLLELLGYSLSLTYQLIRAMPNPVTVKLLWVQISFFDGQLVHYKDNPLEILKQPFFSVEKWTGLMWNLIVLSKIHITLPG